MPSAQQIRTNPTPRTERTPLETILGTFGQKNIENRAQQRESDELKRIYGEYQNNGRNIEKLIMDVNSSTEIGPTAKVKGVEQLVGAQKHNAELQAAAAKRIQEENKKLANQRIISDIEKRRGLEPGTLSAYEEDPKMAEQVTRPPREPKETQADRPIDKDQLRRIDKAMNSPQWEKATNPQKQQMLTRQGVSTANQKPIMESYQEQSKLDKQGDDRDYTAAKNIHERYLPEIKENSEKAQKAKGVVTNLDTAIINNEQYGSGEKIWDTILDATGSPFLSQFKSKTAQELETIIPITLTSFGGKMGGQLTNLKLRAIEKKSVGIGKDKNANRLILYTDKFDKELDILKNRISNEIIDASPNGLAPKGFDQQLESRLYPYQKMIAHDIDRLLNDKKPNSPMSHKKTDGENMTYKMRAPDGRVFNVPYSELEQAIQDDLEFAGS